ncbi:MAG: arginine--tRNA ligase [Candidatus Paceibacterota bacterium]
MITDTIKNSIKAVLDSLEIEVAEEQIELEHPAELSHGDYACNIALRLAGELSTNPRELAEKIVAALEGGLPEEVTEVTVAGPGFINFHLSSVFFAESVKQIQERGDDFGTSDGSAGRKTIFEYTTQNLLKEFHVGHLMSHVIGNAIANIYQSQGAEVRRDSYQGDVGMHIAKAVWAIMASDDPFPADRETPAQKANYLGGMYAAGDTAFTQNESSREKIEVINEQIYSGKNAEVSEVYKNACQWSLESYQSLYDRLGVQLDWQFFESETAPIGKDIVQQGLDEGIFEENDGAVIYRGDEEAGLHTRVFINSAGIPTYEAKDLGLMQLKYQEYAYDEAVIFTANEQNEYFKVVLAAAGEAIPDLAEGTTHIGHGMLQLKDGKMSSRTGDVLSAEELLDTVKERAKAKIADRLDTDGREAVAENIAQAAVRYAILKGDAAKNVAFDTEQALSFEGNSGPYLQYTYARCRSLLEKAAEEGFQPDAGTIWPEETTDIERLLYRFPSVVARAADQYAPHLIATYLHDLARIFNTFYGNTQIVVAADETPYRLALVQTTAQTLKNGLHLLGITAPEEM